MFQFSDLMPWIAGGIEEKEKDRELESKRMKGREGGGRGERERERERRGSTRKWGNHKLNACNKCIEPTSVQRPYLDSGSSR